MLECLVIGDSIAVGTHKFRPECVAYAQSGITSHGWNKKYGNKDLSAKTVIISLSTNDWEKADTYATLMDIRTKIKDNPKVFWIQPTEQYKPLAVQNVRKVAEHFGDVVLPTTSWSDKYHPSWAGYKSLAERTK